MKLTHPTVLTILTALTITSLCWVALCGCAGRSAEGVNRPPLIEAVEGLPGNGLLPAGARVELTAQILDLDVPANERTIDRTISWHAFELAADGETPLRELPDTWHAALGNPGYWDAPSEIDKSYRLELDVCDRFALCDHWEEIVTLSARKAPRIRSIVATPPNPLVGDAVEFTVTASDKEDTSDEIDIAPLKLRYTWQTTPPGAVSDFTPSENTTTFVASSPGVVELKVTVSDSDDFTASRTVSIAVTEPPEEEE